MSASVRQLPGIAVLFGSAVLIAACVASPGSSSSAPSTPASASGGPSAEPSAPASPSGAPSYAPSPSASPSVGLLVEVTTEGGFIGPAAHIGTLPTVWISDDGRILMPAPMTMQFPGRLVPELTVRDVRASGAATIRKAITDAGLDTSDYTDPSPGMPDVGQWVITVRVDGRTVTSRFNGLGGEGSAAGGATGGLPAPAVSGTGASASSAGDPKKAAAAALIARLTNVDETWGTSTPAKETRFVPSGYRIWVNPGAPQADAALAREPIAWPLSVPLASFGEPASPDFGIAGLRVGTVTGADASALAPILDKATTITPFTSGGSSWTLRVRPLLPGEPAS